MVALLKENKISIVIYRHNPKYCDIQASANSVDPDQTPQKAASDQGLNCLPLTQHYFRYINMQYNRLCFQILGQVW